MHAMHIACVEYSKEALHLKHYLCSAWVRCVSVYAFMPRGRLDSQTGFLAGVLNRSSQLPGPTEGGESCGGW